MLANVFPSFVFTLTFNCDLLSTGPNIRIAEFKCSGSASVGNGRPIQICSGPESDLAEEYLPPLDVPSWVYKRSRCAVSAGARALSQIWKRFAGRTYLIA